MRLSVKQFRDKARKLELSQLGWVDEEALEAKVKRYATARQKWKNGSFNIFTDDPGCKTCNKKG